ncbi:MAG: sigma-70 family RNA polymerase sigma factor [Pseudomonadota bacterium]|nr:sigma-70 family RNA polymerase sigma factor [Pseudomonadota bacterium]
MIALYHYRRRGTARIERIDYEQLAYEGLLQAIDRFDPLKGVPFRAYAKPRIAGNIADGVARMSEIDAQLSHRHRIEQERLRSLAALGDDEADGPLQALSDLTVGLALGIILQGTRLLADADAADPAPNAYQSLEWNELRARLAAAVDQLPPKEAALIRQHYETGLNFAQIAELLGLSRGRISQLHGAAIERLRKKIGAFGKGDWPL